MATQLSDLAKLFSHFEVGHCSFAMIYSYILIADWKGVSVFSVFNLWKLNPHGPYIVCPVELSASASTSLATMYTWFLKKNIKEPLSSQDFSSTLYWKWIIAPEAFTKDRLIRGAFVVLPHTPHRIPRLHQNHHKKKRHNIFSFEMDTNYNLRKKPR